MPVLMVASTKPGTGKTAIAAALAAHFVALGRKVSLGRAFSATGSDDSAALRTLVQGATALDLAAGNQPAAVRQIAARLPSPGTGDISIIEGESGESQPNRSLAEEVDAAVVLVAGLDDDIVPVARIYGSRFLGVVINNVPRYKAFHLETAVVPALRQAGIPYLGAVPEDRRLLAPTLNLIAEHLEADFALLPEHGDRLIDNFLIGGLVLDWGPTYFGSKENVGVIVRGDRPDVQMAAIQTDTVRAMVLTKGIPPIEYIFYEAGQREVPIVVSKYDTHETALRLESLLPKIRFDHPGKLARLSELAADHLDLPAIDRAMTLPVTR